MTATIKGEWTATPPTVPGWYWWRKSGTAGITFDKWPFAMWVHIRNDLLWVSSHKTHCAMDEQTMALLGGEWWSVPIQEPPA